MIDDEMAFGIGFNLIFDLHTTTTIIGVSDSDLLIAARLGFDSQ